MTTLPKFFLTLSLAAFAAGAIVTLGNFDLHPSWTVAMPAGAIFFGLFLIAYVLQNEVAQFDEEAAKQERPTPRKAPWPAPGQDGKLASGRLTPAAAAQAGIK